MKISDNKLEAALQYSSQSIPVFPIDANSKRPFSNEQLARITLLPHPERKNANGAISGGFHQATTDVETIKAWWQQYPNANIGMPTGPESGIWALDIDNDPGNGKDGFASLANLESKHGSLPHSIRTNTPRGGLHN